MRMEYSSPVRSPFEEHAVEVQVERGNRGVVAHIGQLFGIDLIDGGKRIRRDPERARNLPDAALGKVADHGVERVGIEHRVPAADKPEIAVENAVPDRAVAHERRSETELRAQPVEAIGRRHRLGDTGRRHRVKRVEHFQHLAGGRIRHRAADASGQVSGRDDIADRRRGPPNQVRRTRLRKQRGLRRAGIGPHRARRHQGGMRADQELPSGHHAKKPVRYVATMQTGDRVSSPALPQLTGPKPVQDDQSPRARISVDDTSTIGTFRKTQAGASLYGSRLAWSDDIRARSKTWAALAVRADIRCPGRASTQIGTVRMIQSQRCQRWNCARLSAPISQTNLTPG
jgi:hypothetical protein